MKFYNRKQELKALNDWWREKKSHLVILYGKRRVGKTALSLEFAKGKPSIFYLAERLDSKLQLEKISKEVGNFFKDEYVSQYGFTQWEQFFKYIADKNERMVIIIDEFPYLVDSDPAIPSIFQKGWNLHLSKSKTFLILCGSSIGMMEKHTLIHGAPLYGRRSGQILVRPFNFSDLEELFPDSSFDERLMIFSTVGGTITYLKNFLSKENFWNVVENKILSKEQFLYEEVEFLLREELREPRNYFSILLALSLGKRKTSEIINYTGFDKATVSSYLSILQQLLIVEKEIPVTEKFPEKSRKGLYKISDNFFEFWFRYVFRNKKLIEEGNSKEVIGIIKGSQNEFISSNYEEVSREWVKHNIKTNFQYVGRWWDKNDEIDLVGIDSETKEIIFGECKWSNKKVGTNIFIELEGKAQKVEWNNGQREENFILFSKSGFTADMIKLAKERGNVVLVDKNKLVKLNMI
ncbi:MAG: hypothetical protein US25_C0030G0003 [Candidatus Moranbacteria bacterium GW2011_GWE1_36_7]|nr:MAG: hypothetical protein US16_C0039G0003 [Candidatus Moranbacteria bacterium GW2011_GWE2_36_40]KKQ14081.1 MAG: hypothetical protein US25_C0030G0003 [Candidatus Moranbacteria bacterium GW2011_GWE1_36_7]